MDHGRESKNDLKASTNASHNKRDSWAPLISLVDSDNGSGSLPESEINLEEIEIGRDSVQSLDSSGRSSTSSNSSSGDFFQVIPHTLPRSHPSIGIPKPNGGIKQLYKNDRVDVSNEALYRLEESITGSPESTSRFSDITHESLLPQMSPTQSPFIQVMERPGNFDPGRIPSSIFSKPLSPMEWSVASNESLFSIHIGNHSFRGRASKMGKDMYRSGELLKSEEPFNSKQIYQSGELYMSEELYQSEEPFKSGDPKRTSELSGSELNFSASKEVQPDENIDMEKNLSQNWKPGAKGAIDVPVISEAHIDQGGINLGEPKDSFSTNQLPDRSEAIVQSNSFTKKKKSACSFCHCSNCRRLFCSCSWPSCSYKWSDFSCEWWSCCSCRSFGCPSCSNSCLNCPSCHWKSCWPSCICKCPSCPSCHCKVPTFSSCCWCSSWPSCCCNCPSWPSCKCHCLDSSWLCCCCWSKPKTSSLDSSYSLAGSRMAYPISVKASSSKRCYCFSCHSCSHCC
ncbi:uncharacterized protein LOC142555286 [Primulina tabacum]|uniref:uncharacterized protein LOC142555286 n=1 Tax=Primulina tabacum TaxID=48773 RepID=UPI003F591BCA